MTCVVKDLQRKQDTALYAKRISVIHCKQNNAYNCVAVSTH